MARFGKGYRAFDVRDAANDYSRRYRSIRRERSSSPETPNGELPDPGTVQPNAIERRQHDQRDDR
jgi:hypothetical protein